MKTPRRKPNKQAGSIIFAIAVVLAASIGLAYLTNNTTGSQAAVLLADPTVVDISIENLPKNCDAIWAEYDRLLNVLGDLLEHQQYLLDRLYRTTDADERIRLRWQLWLLSFQIKDASIAVNEYASNHPECFPRKVLPPHPYY